jgi:predicted Zn-ribbon and HTH transcriptional regulator
MAAKQILNNVASSNLKLKLSKVGTFYHSHSFQITSAIYTSGRVFLGLPSYDISRLRVNKTQSRVVIGLLTVHKTLRRHLYIMVLRNNPTCKKCGTEEETSVHILCECEALASLRCAHLGSFFMDPEDIRKLTLCCSYLKPYCMGRKTAFFFNGLLNT